MTKVVALLPLKANSERVRGKNFRDFLGKPLFRWMLDELLATPEVDQVVINTDAKHLLEEKGLPQSPKLLLRDRRREIQGDFVSMNLIIQDDIAAVPADTYLQTHVTNPLLTRATIGGAIRAFEEAHRSGRADSLFTVTRYQSRFYWPDGRAVNHDPQKLIRTQDLEPLYEENSNLYVFTAESFRATQARIGAKPLLMDMPRLEAVDIDDAETWTLAEAVGRALGRGA